jgi:hypothetical protein
MAGELKPKLFGWFRVAIYFVFVGALVATCALQSAKDDVAKQSLALGRMLSPQLKDLTGEAYLLRINGQPVNIAVNEVEGTLKDALDRLEAACNADPDLVARDWKDVPKAKDWKPSGQTFKMSNLGVVRRDGDVDGVVMCMARGQNSAPTFEEALEQFAQTKDMGRVGKLRYAYVDASKKPGHVWVTAMWTEDSFNFGAFDVPATGDSPGTDSPTAPRPPSGQRVFSAEAVGMPYSMRIYKTDVSPEDVLRFYDQRMVQTDWTAYAPPADAHMYLKGGIVTMVVANRKPGEPTMVSVADLGGEGAQGPVAPTGPLPKLQ